MNNLKIAALITCRGNNSLKKKHLRFVGDKKLIEYPLREVKKCKLFDRLYISTDDEEILNIAKKYNYQTIRRPHEISKSDSQHIDAIKHALSFMNEKDNFKPDILVVILGNTVYIKKEWIEECIKIITNDKTISAVIPAYLDQDHHPHRAKYIDQKGFLKNYFEDSSDKISTNRQDLPKNYFLCHNFWTLNVEESIKKESTGDSPWKFMGNKIYPLILKTHLDVHDKNDLILCEEWLKNEKNLEGKQK